jgi:uncharacterized protein (TIGR02448 family)
MTFRFNVQLVGLPVALMLFTLPAAADFLKLEPNGSDPLYGTTYMTSLFPLYTSAEASWSTSDASSNTRLRAAREDAAAYVASNGEIRGAQLESALRQLREDPTYRQYSDPQLVQAILAWSSG